MIIEPKSFQEVKARLKKLYFYEELIQGDFYPLHLERCKKYFRNKKRKNNIKPYLLRLSSSIPKKNLKKGHRLLPLRAKKGGHSYSNFIEVPVEIVSYVNVIYFLRQLMPFDKKNNKRLEKERSLAYILGMIVSDTSKPEGYRFSNQCLISLTRKYSWNLKIGEKMCESFRNLGIKANRIKDNSKLRKRSPHGEYRWISEKSPFIKYILRTCLSLKKGECTTYHKIKMNWLSSAPKNFLIPFLQGICDGDGCAHNFWRIEIACDPNQQLIKELLNKLGMKSYIDKDSVNIAHQKSILIASSLPLFLNAEGRIKKLKKVVEMIQNQRNFRGEIPNHIKKKIILLKNDGFSCGQLSEHLFDQFDISLNPNAINHFHRTHSDKS